MIRSGWPSRVGRSGTFGLLGRETVVDQYLSKERVERDGYLVYAEGDPIPESDVDELRRQGYLTGTSAPAPAAEPVEEKPKGRKPAANKARKATPNK
jgi:hypothetical protein